MNTQRKSTKVMKDGGMFSPEARAARKEKRTEKKITKQISKSVSNSGKAVESKKVVKPKGIVKAVIKGTLQSLKPLNKDQRAFRKAHKDYKKSIEDEFNVKMPKIKKR
jgi:hypothetical protein